MKENRCKYLTDGGSINGGYYLSLLILLVLLTITIEETEVTGTAALRVTTEWADIVQAFVYHKERIAKCVSSSKQQAAIFVEDHRKLCIGQVRPTKDKAQTEKGSWVTEKTLHTNHSTQKQQ